MLIGVGMLQSYHKDSQVALIDFAGGGNTQWFAILKFQSDNSMYWTISPALRLVKARLRQTSLMTGAVVLILLAAKFPLAKDLSKEYLLLF